MCVLPNGNVGIGDTNPPVALSVNGPIKIGDTALSPSVAGAGSIRWSSADEVLQFSDGADWKDVSEGAPDGSSCDKAASDGWQLKQDHPNLPSGDYSIKPGGTNPCITMYVDMTANGGGYDFYKVTGGSSGNYRTNSYSCPAGTDISAPRSHEWWLIVENVYGRIYGSYNAVPGVYRPDGSGTYVGCIMRSSHYGSSCANWRVADGGRWWLRNSTFTEPNGDYPLNGWLGMYDASYTGDIGFNDGGSGYTSSGTYLCSTNVHYKD
jgi:hypothetical protein